MAVWNLRATFRSTNGVAAPYDAFAITVTCEVTSWTAPSAPTTGLGYSVFDFGITIDVSDLAYVQSPPCGYAYTSVYSWTGLGDPVS